MAGKLLSSSISAPGFMGLNTQESGVTLESGFATKAYNCIIDKYGRLGSRRGWELLTTNSDGLSTSPVESLFEFKDIDRSITILSAGNGKFFKGTTTLTNITVNGADSGGTNTPLSPQPTFTGNRWQFAQLAEGAGIGASMYGFAVQNSNPMLVYRKAGHTGAYSFQKIGDYGSKPSGVSTFDPDCIISAFGRIWVAGVTGAKSTIYYSKLLDGSQFTGTGSGLIDIASVVGNNDDIVAIASHHKYLVIFCRNNIVVYSGADTPTTMAVADVITGVGCIARDSVQATGTDLIFLSRSGVRSLNRTIQENSMPMRELSLNIKDDLTDYINNETITNIKSAYFERDAFYLLSLPNLQQIIYFDLRTVLQNGAARVTIWTGVDHKAFLQTEDRNLYFGVDGGIGRYYGYTDNNTTYRLEYFTASTDVSAPTTLKLLKKVSVVIIGSGLQDFVIKYAFDYINSFSSRAFNKDLGGAPAYYNIDEYGIAEFTGGTSINTVSVNASGSGKVIQLGVEAVINGSPVSVQKIDMYMVSGKTI